MEEETIDSKIKRLLKLTNKFIFPEYYSHTDTIMWKINNQYTNYKENILVSCKIDQGIDTALNLAIIQISSIKDTFLINNIYI